MNKWTPAWIVGICLVTAGLGLAGTAAITGASLPQAFKALASSTTEAAPGAPDGEAIETFKGKIDPATVTTGTIDFRVYRGNVHVVAWDKPEYEITVWQRVEGDGQQLGDAQLDVQFEETKKDGLGLFLTVVPTGTTDIRLNQHAQIGVVAYVPNLDWQTAFVCSGIQSDRFKIFEDNPVWQSEQSQPDCLAGDRPISMHMRLGNPLEESKANKTGLGIPFLVEGIHGKELTLVAEYASFGVKDVAFEKAALFTEYGSIEGSIIASELAAFTEYGSIKLSMVADDAAIATEYGSIALHVLGGGSGAIQTASEYGSIKVILPKADAQRGYDVTAATEYGRVKIAISDAEEPTTLEEDEERENETAAAVPGLTNLPGFGDKSSAKGGPAKPNRHHDGEESGRAVSKDFDAKSVQVVVEAFTEYGSILVTDLAKTMKDLETEEKA